MVFPWFSMVFLWYSHLSYGFPMMFHMFANKRVPQPGIFMSFPSLWQLPRFETRHGAALWHNVCGSRSNGGRRSDELPTLKHWANGNPILCIYTHILFICIYTYTYYIYTHIIDIHILYMYIHIYIYIYTYYIYTHIIYIHILYI